MRIQISKRREDGLGVLAALILAAIIIVVGAVIVHYLRKWAERLDGLPMNPNTNDVSFVVPPGTVSAFDVQAESLQYGYIDQSNDYNAMSLSAQPTLELCILIDTNGVLDNWMAPIPTNWQTQTLSDMNVPTDPGSGIPANSVWASSLPGAIQVDIYRSTDLTGATTGGTNWFYYDSINVDPGVTNIYIDGDPPPCGAFYETVYTAYIQSD